jgi:nuclear pore complex protein Nup107
LGVSSSRESLCVAILEAYIQFLIDRNQIELVAYYTAQLPKSNQITTFAKLLEGIEDEDDRKMCILLAKNANLDINSITMTLVDNVRVKTEEDMQLSHELMNATNSEDKKKINSLDWLLFSEVQEWSEALKQTNSLMRSFLLSRKVDAMKDAFNKLPETIIDNVYKQWIRRTGSSHLSAEEDNAVREYLCHKAYIQATDAFTDW